MIGAIENAMIARIEAANASGALGYTLRTVKSYGGQFDGDVDKVVRQFPAVLVAFLREPLPEAVNNVTYRHKPVFAVMAANRSRRNEASRRKGAGASEVGSFQILKDARALLVGQQLGLEIGHLEPGPVTTLFDGVAKSKQLSILAVEFSTSYVEQTSEPLPAHDFATLHADWDIPTFGEGRKGPFAPGVVPLPDGESDATDDVPLEIV